MVHECFVILGFFVMVRMVMLMRGGTIQFMLIGMGGTVAMVGMLMVVLEGVGMTVVVHWRWFWKADHRLARFPTVRFATLEFSPCLFHRNV
ncbi:MAG: hypothetical protein KKA54_03150 [Proteobacteria bacterium]|nr:hypothetical protein [Pseudomonadota bacterium]